MKQFDFKTYLASELIEFLAKEIRNKGDLPVGNLVYDFDNVHKPGKVYPLVPGIGADLSDSILLICDDRFQMGEVA